jgi:hypothetical protein
VHVSTSEESLRALPRGGRGSSPARHQGMFVQEVPAGGALNPMHHMYDEFFMAEKLYQPPSPSTRPENG